MRPAYWMRSKGALNKAVPFIGDYRPEDFDLVDRATLVVPEDVPASKVHDAICDAPYIEVDTSGWGTPAEMVLTSQEFLRVAAANPDIGWALVEVGQFQGVVGAFRLRA
ncbi:MAG: hypothetical protein MUC79_14430 [Thiobacillaceae bacterium]|nr:hypothetical protein [Thiobacillaceae bacterium]